MKNTPKLISYTIVDFPSETHMELGTRFFEEKASEFFNNADNKGVLRWRMYSCLLYTSDAAVE